MSTIEFEWDERKNTNNNKKHGVDFNEAKSVFYDENALEYSDDTHSENEDRYLMLGLSGHLHILIVSYTVRKTDNETLIRIISSRKATKKEQKEYPRGKK
jgi:uncharacterized DUF497 family protein